MTFAALFVSEKREKKKTFFMFLYGGSKPPPYDKTQSIANGQNKRFMPIRFFFCIYRRKRKSYQKENAGRRFRTLRSATRALPFEPASL